MRLPAPACVVVTVMALAGCSSAATPTTHVAVARPMSLVNCPQPQSVSNQTAVGPLASSDADAVRGYLRQARHGVPRTGYQRIRISSTRIAYYHAVGISADWELVAAPDYADPADGWRVILASRCPSASTASDPTVDFTVGYLPAGYRYFNTEHAPRNIVVDVTRRYALGGDPHRGVIFVEAQYGLVSTLEQYRQNNGPLHDTSINGHRAVVGWNTGRVGEGVHLLYVPLDAHTSIEVNERPATPATSLSDADLEQIAATVTVHTSESATSTITIPNVIGLSQQAAVNALDAAGAGTPVVEDRYGTTIARDHVISQSPAAGARQPRGTTVTLTVAG